MKIKIGITGQVGFLGTHLFNTLNLYSEIFQTLDFEDRFFSDTTLLNAWVKKCDVIIHLAALNRHNDPDVIYNTNILLVKKLITALETTNTHPHILFSSSTQEERENLYGKSKKEGRILFENWAKKNNTKFTGLIIPNIFGPFGNPFFNSVVATFCYQITHNEQPIIDLDSELKLIYVGELVDVILQQIRVLYAIDTRDAIVETILVNPTTKIKVSDLLKKIEDLKISYFENGIIPNLNHEFDRNLFNTFLSYIDHKNFFPFQLKKNSDNRGSFTETIKLNSGGQISFSTTNPGITRGNHYHTRKAERFAVIKGKAIIEIRKINSEEKLTFELDGENPSFVDMPIWFTHNIKNIGNEDLYTIFWISEFFNSSDPDVFSEKV